MEARMPDVERRGCYQAAVLWPATVPDAYGQMQVGDPVEIRVQWSTVRTERLDPNGASVSLDGTARVKQEVAIGSRMWLGTLDAYNALSTVDSEVVEVKTWHKVPDCRNRAFAREVGFIRMRNTP